LLLNLVSVLKSTTHFGNTIPNLTHLSATMSPILHKLSTRQLTVGATAGAAIGATAAGVLVIIGLVLIAMWYRRSHHITSLPNNDTAEKGVQRCHSCKRPQHHKMPREPQAAALKEHNQDVPHWEEEMGRPLVHKPWLHDIGSRVSFSPSFSSKRATRMMMVM
jgi:hypothetical protein